MTATSSFPPDLPSQTYLSIKALVAGHVWLQDGRVFLDSKEKPADVGSWVPAFSFLIVHPTKGKALFDLGVRKASLSQLITVIKSYSCRFNIYC